MSTLLLTVCALFATGLAVLSGVVDRAGARPGLLLGLLPAVVVGSFYAFRA